MGSSLPPELNLIETTLSLINNTFSEFLSEIASIKSSSERSSRINDFLEVLIEEQKKIEVLENELPLRKLLVNDVIETLKKYKQKHFQDDEKIENGDKEWMNSHRLLTKFEPNSRQNLSSQKLKGVIEEKTPVADNPFKSCKSTAGRGTFLRLKGLPNFPAMAKQRENKESGFRGNSTSSNAPSGVTNLLKMLPPPSRQQQEAGRELEREWTHELHKKFVKVVEKLGGSEEATPNQILELMQGEDLTHNEVTSQLRKYRMHIKRALDAGTSSRSSNSNSGSLTGPLQSNEIVGANRNVVEDRLDEAKGRCWTYELHKKFVNAVEILGGSAEANPKQILELMQVEGLNSSEVASQLQKYRIHIKQSLGAGTNSGSSDSNLSSPTVPLQSNENVEANPIMVEDRLDDAKGMNWTYELHKKFVNVVEILGGFEEATPKKILELMQVEELTENDVMNHLLKYRIHTKRSLGAGTDSGNSGSSPGSPTGPLQSNENPNMVEDGLDGAREDGELDRMDGFWN